MKISDSQQVTSQVGNTLKEENILPEFEIPGIGRYIVDQMTTENCSPLSLGRTSSDWLKNKGC